MTHNAIRPQDHPAVYYEQDYYLWLTQTAQHLRQQAFDQLDRENLIEEIEDTGRSEKRAIERNLRGVLMYLLKGQYQVSTRSGSWKGSIAEHRMPIRKALRDSPSLKNTLQDVLAATYQDTIKVAVQETGLESETLSASCEWTVQQVLDEEWLPH